jgi:hypothetical protein
LSCSLVALADSCAARSLEFRGRDDLLLEELLRPFQRGLCESESASALRDCASSSPRVDLGQDIALTDAMTFFGLERRRMPESCAFTPTERIGSSIPAMTEVRDTDPRFTSSISTLVGRSETPARPPTRPVPARPELADVPEAGSPPAGLVQEIANDPAARAIPNMQYCFNLRDNRPPLLSEPFQSRTRKTPSYGKTLAAVP